MAIALLPTANQVFFRAIIPGFSTSGAKLDTAYVEFSNGQTVPPSEIAPETLRVYFDGLATVPNRDYLRIPILSHTLGQSEEGKPQLTLVIATDGSQGVHHKPFSASSRVYAVTLVASQLETREDIFVARHHYLTEDQLQKPATGSIMMTLDLV